MTHRYYGKWRSLKLPRYGEPCRLVFCGRRRKCLIEFEDKWRIVTLVSFLRRM